METTVLKTKVLRDLVLENYQNKIESNRKIYEKIDKSKGIALYSSFIEIGVANNTEELFIIINKDNLEVVVIDNIDLKSNLQLVLTKDKIKEFIVENNMEDINVILNNFVNYVSDILDWLGIENKGYL